MVQDGVRHFEADPELPKVGRSADARWLNHEIEAADLAVRDL
jgi:hypothetical protein